jgi:hypothetical protein
MTPIQIYNVTPNQIYNILVKVKKAIKKLNEVKEILENLRFKCPHCLSCVNTEEFVFDLNICVYCYNYALSYCSACKQLKQRQSIRRIKGRNICSECLTSEKCKPCPNCGTWNEVEDGKYYKCSFCDQEP